MLKVLFFFTQQIAPTAGGVERVVSCIYNELSKRNYKITTLFLVPYIGDDIIPDQIQLPSIDGRSKENKAFIIELIESVNFDIAINFGAIFNRSSQAFVDACSTKSIPIISVYHNTLDWILWLNPVTNRLMRHEKSRIILRNLYSLYQKFPFIKNAQYISRKSAASVVLAPCYKTEYLQLIDSKPNHLTSIYNPLTLSEHQNDITLEEKKNEVLFVGRLESQKNIIDLLYIWNVVRNNDWKLIIIGEGSLRPLIERYIANYKLSNSILLLGHQNKPQYYYKRAKIFAMTSIYEGFPMTLIECQAYGCVPIIYDSYPAAKEIIIKNNNGILIPNGDKQTFINKLYELMTHDQITQKLSIGCIKMTNKFSINSIINEWINLINLHSKK